MNIKNTYFNFEGRIGRQRFWLYYVLPIMILSALLQTSAEYYGNILVNIGLFLINILLLICMASGFVKRLHDRGKSAWWLILCFIPVIGTIYWVIDLGILPAKDEKISHDTSDVIDHETKE